MSDDVYNTTGGRIVDSLTTMGEHFKDAAGDGIDPTAFAIDGAIAALDVLAFAANPFKELMMAGVGFIIEHVDWLREPLEMLTGSPAEITALSQGWSNVAADLNDAAGQFAEAVGQIDNWEGDAGDAYREVTTAFSGAIAGAASCAQSTSQAIAVAGIIVATVRALVLEIISDWVCRAIMWLLAALASAVVTFGASVPTAISGVVVDACISMTKIVSKISKMMQKVAELLRKIKVFQGAFGKLANSLDDMAEGMMKGMAKTDAKALVRHIDDVLVFNTKPRFGNDHGVNTTFDAAKDVYKNGANWGRDAFGNPTGLRDVADRAGDILHTGIRGTLGGIKSALNDTEAEPPEDRHDDE
jgi:uncharacterized protein YukE